MRNACQYRYLFALMVLFPFFSASAQDSIAKFKGSLPCPLKYFVVYEGPRGVIGSEAPDPGILFTTSDSTPVSVCTGIVKSTAHVPDKGTLIIVRNGPYFFVYCGFDKINVQEGDSLKVSDRLGTLIKRDDRYELTFQVWKGAQKLNAEEWLECTSGEKKARK
ncbi:MAG TPA: M23 family metallopeptidase [Bacteroidia bacterium]|jgi:hypothetical protein|nr:M23 family metallopeptidase [Bacteroidia bacterium]